MVREAALRKAKTMTNSQIIQDEEIIRDAHEAADAAVDQGFFSTWSLSDDEGPYYGDVELALRGTVYGDAHREATEPFAFDVEHISEEDMSEWVEIYRDRIFELGCKELGVDAE
jgi:hypothetical protein